MRPYFGKQRGVNRELLNLIALLVELYGADK